MKNCFEGYLTEACNTCEYWCNSATAIGCGAPFPIDHCNDFARMCEEEDNNDL